MTENAVFASHWEECSRASAARSLPSFLKVSACGYRAYRRCHSMDSCSDSEPATARCDRRNCDFGESRFTACVPRSCLEDGRGRPAFAFLREHAVGFVHSTCIAAIAVNESTDESNGMSSDGDTVNYLFRTLDASARIFASQTAQMTWFLPILPKQGDRRPPKAPCDADTAC